jgi:outer membrane protein assembly factor BamE (lipoprotein component of BamABCDE complex)
MSVIMLVCLSSFLFTNGCVNMHEWHMESQNALNAKLKKCINHGMKKGELIMQVGQPTAKEIVEEGEIWIYELVDRGNTTTTGQVGPFGTFSATSSTSVDKSTVIVRFDKKGVMVSVATSGPARGPFRFLRAR